MAKDRELWGEIRRALLVAVDAIERWLELEPRTSELRKAYKDGKLLV